jgi:hypothetical protein
MLATFFGLLSDRAGGLLLITAGVLFWMSRDKPNRAGVPIRYQLTPEKKRIGVAFLIIFGCIDLIKSFSEPAAPRPAIAATTKITGDGKFEVYLPAPVKSSENTENLIVAQKHYHRWVSGTDPNLPSYFFQYADYEFVPGASVGMTEVTETMVRAGPAGGGVTVQNRESVTVSGFPATHLTGTGKDGQMADLVFCAVGHRLYMLIRACGKMPRPASDGFFDDFKILGP